MLPLLAAPVDPNPVIVGWELSATLGAVAAPWGGPEARATAALWFAREETQPFQWGDDVGPGGQWATMALAASGRPHAVAVEGEAAAMATITLGVSVGLYADGGPLWAPTGPGWTASGGLRVLLRPDTCGVQLDLGLGGEHVETTALRGSVRLGADVSRPFRRAVPTEMDDCWGR